jgi:hypothetical protein
LILTLGSWILGFGSIDSIEFRVFDAAIEIKSMGLGDRNTNSDCLHRSNSFSETDKRLSEVTI